MSKTQQNDKKQLNNYSSEFRISAVKLVAESDQPIAKIARDLGINVNTLYILLPIT
jgi:transposase